MITGMNALEIIILVSMLAAWIISELRHLLYLKILYL